MSTALLLRRRSQLLGVPAFVKGEKKRLGFVTQVWVDPHNLQVVGWSIRRQEPSPSVVAIKRSATRLLGTGALLIEPEGLSDSLNTDDCVRLVPQTLKTQAGVTLGKIKDFTFELASGAIASVQTSGTGIALLPQRLDTTFEISRSDLAIGEGLVAVEGAEGRLSMLRRGLLEKVGIGKFDWSRELSASNPADLDSATLEAIAEAATAAAAEGSSQPSISGGSDELDSAAEPALSPSADSDRAASDSEQSEPALPNDADRTSEVTPFQQPLDRLIEVLTASVQPLLLKLPQPLRDKIGLSKEDEGKPPESDDETESVEASPAEDASELEAEEFQAAATEAVSLEKEETDSEPIAQIDEAAELDEETETELDEETETETDEELEDKLTAEESASSEWNTDIEGRETDATHREPLSESTDSGTKTEEEATVAVAREAPPKPYFPDREGSAGEEAAETVVEVKEKTAVEESAVDWAETSAEANKEERESDRNDGAEEPPELIPDADAEEPIFSIEPENTINQPEPESTAVGTTSVAATEVRLPPESERPAEPKFAPHPTSKQDEEETDNPEPAPVPAPSALQPSPGRMRQPIARPRIPIGTPLENRVPLPKTSGRVPKAGGCFEPKVKGS